MNFVVTVYKKREIVHSKRRILHLKMLNVCSMMDRNGGKEQIFYGNLMRKFALDESFFPSELTLSRLALAERIQYILYITLMIFLLKTTVLC